MCAVGIGEVSLGRAKCQDPKGKWAGICHLRGANLPGSEVGKETAGVGEEEPLELKPGFRWR